MELLHMTADSGLSFEPDMFGSRDIRFDRFSNTFTLVKIEMTAFDRKRYKFLIMDKASGVTLITSRSIAEAFLRLEYFLADKDQIDLEMFITMYYD